MRKTTNMSKTVLKKSKAFYETFYRKPGEDKQSTTYCAGCGHGIVHKLIAEALEDFDMTERTTFISPVGCSVFAYYYFKCGNIQAAHGRAPAVATGIKRAHPDSYVISYQGDGDLASIGMAEIIHAANRGENITVFFINNAIYGMTGGQMAPTSVVGQKTATSPYGRSIQNEGFPIKIAEIISTLKAPVFVARASLHDIKNIMKTRMYIRKALLAQKERKGFCLVEILSQCPTAWKVKPEESSDWIKEYMLPYYKLGVFLDKINEIESKSVKCKVVPPNKIIQKLGLSKQKMNLKTKLDKTIKKIISNKIDLKIESEIKFKIAGFGGQGVLSLGALLCEIAINNKYKASWIPSYGPEMRGGTANCSVSLSNAEIASPVFKDINILIAMNQLSFNKFRKEVIKSGYIFYNSSITKIDEILEKELKDKCIHLIPVNASILAEKAGDLRTANIVVLGRLLKEFPYFNFEDVFTIIEKKFYNKEKLVDINKQAYNLGFKS